MKKEIWKRFVSVVVGVILLSYVVDFVIVRSFGTLTSDALHIFEVHTRYGGVYYLTEQANIIHNITWMAPIIITICALILGFINNRKVKNNSKI